MPYAAAKAVLEVECAGHGFASNGKPTVLFEAHKFGRLTNYRWNASYPQLSTKTWSEARKHYKGGSDEWDRFLSAAALDENAAIQAASWGLGQVMGFNHKLCGYETPRQFRIAMETSEALQFKAMLDFCKANNLIQRLINQDWHGFARGYNGPGYATNNYHTKLEQAFKKWSQ